MATTLINKDPQTEKKEVVPSQPAEGKKKQKQKFFKKGSVGSENAATPPLPPKAPNAAGPKPTRLSTTPSKAKNELMFSDIDMMDFPGLTPCRQTNEFAVTTEGYIPLCENEYDIIATQQPYFAKTISKSAWVYDCVMGLYARLVNIRQEEGDSSYDEDSFAAQVLSGNHDLPAPIEAYVKCLGHIVDDSSLHYKLRMPAWPSADGNFGRVDQHTHWKYMAMPCPVVCRKRIQEDLRVTATPGVREWNLPQHLRPAEEAAGNPTRNCLGWARAATLTNDQVAFLESANIMEDVFPVKFARFQYNVDLFEKVSLALSKTAEKIKLSPQTRKNSEGFEAQTCWVVVEQVIQDTSPNVFYAESRKSQVIGFAKRDACQSLTSLILSYRVRKDQIGALRPYCMYSFGNYANVPDDWHVTRNHIFNYGRADRWNVTEYTSPFTDKSKYRLAWLKRHVK